MKGTRFCIGGDKVTQAMAQEVQGIDNMRTNLLNLLEERRQHLMQATEAKAVVRPSQHPEALQVIAYTVHRPRWFSS